MGVSITGAQRFEDSPYNGVKGRGHEANVLSYTAKPALFIFKGERSFPQVTMLLRVVQALLRYFLCFIDINICKENHTYLHSAFKLPKHFSVFYI